MERFTISLKPELAKEFDDWIHANGYSNRSEAIRDLIRDRLEIGRLEQDEHTHCVASLTYVYNHHELALASRITSFHHHRHDLNLSTMHVHLDHDNCLETVMLRGPVPEVRAFAQEVIAERGVRHGHLHMIPVELKVSGHTHSHEHDSDHAHGHDHHHPPHVHSRPRT